MAPTFVVSLPKCDHVVAVRIIATYKENQTIRDIFEEIHPSWDLTTHRVECLGLMRSGREVGGAAASENGSEGGLVDWALFRTKKNITKIFQELRKKNTSFISFKRDRKYHPPHKL